VVQPSYAQADLDGANQQRVLIGGVRDHYSVELMRKETVDRELLTEISHRSQPVENPKANRPLLLADAKPVNQTQEN
jgi:hypothetical protein